MGTACSCGLRAQYSSRISKISCVAVCICRLEFGHCRQAVSLRRPHHQMYGQVRASLPYAASHMVMTQQMQQ